MYFLILYIQSTFISFFFFNDTATTEIYTLSLHDALPIFDVALKNGKGEAWHAYLWGACEPGELLTQPPRRSQPPSAASMRSEEHTSELQSRSDLVCRLLLEKKKILDVVRDL